MGSVQHITCGFKNGCRHTTGGTKIEFEWNRLSVVNHEPYALHSTNIGNLMGVTYRCHRTMNNCQPRKSRRNKHGAFNVYMGIYKARANKRQCQIRGNAVKHFNGMDAPLSNFN